MKHRPILVGLVDAVEAAVYIALAATVMNAAPGWVGSAGHPPFGAIAFLMLFVFSAALMGTIVFLRPALAYVNGHKKEALASLGWTIGFLFVFTLAAFLVLALTG